MYLKINKLHPPPPTARWTAYNGRWRVTDDYGGL